MELKAVFFDLDGTITKPVIKWPELRFRIGVPAGITIMDYIESLDGQERKRAEKILEDAEETAAKESEVNDGFREFQNLIRKDGIITAIVTNNSPVSARIVLKKHNLSFDAVFSRGDGRLKPHGDLIQLALKRFDLESNQCRFIGDGDLDMRASEKACVPFIRLLTGSGSIFGAYQCAAGYYELIQLYNEGNL